jgi:hypothetical protein
MVGMCLSSQGEHAEARGWFERAVEEMEQGDVHGRVDETSLQISRDALDRVRRRVEQASGA